MSYRVESDHIGLNLQFQTVSNKAYLYCIWQSITLMGKNQCFEAKSNFHKFKFSTPEDIFYNIENNFAFQNAYFAK